MSVDMIWYIAFGVNLILMVAIGLFLIYFLLRRFSRRKSEESPEQRANQLIEQAHLKAQNILAQAQNRAGEMLSNTQVLKQELEDEFKASFKGSLTKYNSLLDEEFRSFVEKYEDNFKKVRGDFLGQARQALNEVENEVKDGVQKTLQDVVADRVSSQKDLQKKIDQQLDQAKKEIQQYKQEELVKVEHSIDDLIMKLAKELLRKSITTEEHRRLIFEALERAKTQGIFNL